ncbi:HDR120Wp [Eremothecium sinecaudum]|uniref:Mitochondrial inner membrane protease subunit 2 n=1 Tax=Eremothecium sinecaudum TaxID=45286 RepID=A0A0X8HSW9_9SACH|nr:HDR120Wp [Eremothecium sinecaudum]AMD20862.1 HDR120Wp [Eremothecium sinecaudum]
MFRNRFIKYTVLTCSWIPVYITVTHHVVSVANIQGMSMRPVLNPRDDIGSDWVLLWKLGKTNIRNLDYGDIVLFKSPTNPKKVYCKRVLGKEYDTVKTRHPFPRETCTIPKSHLWVEGDNMSQSVDSNNFGPISTGLVIGKVTKVLWPPTRWGAKLSNGVSASGAVVK